MQKMEGISVIITAYNAENFIEDCVYSLLHQETNFPYEIIIGVDGCESTLSCLESLPYVGVYYSKKNVGSFVMRNSLVKKSKYDNLVFFDADDIAMQDLLQVSFDGLKNNDAVRWRYFDFRKFGDYNLSRVQAFGAMSINKEVFFSVNGYHSWRFGTDSEFVSRIEQYGKSIHKVEEAKFFRRVHSESLTQHPETGMKSEARQALKAELIPKIKEGLLSDPNKIQTTTLKKIKDPETLMPVKLNIGIGITTFERPLQISQTLLQIKKHTPRGVKIVVIDDGGRTPVKDATFRYEKNQGAPIAKNKCLELLDDCEHIFLFDDDTYPIKEGWEQEYIDAGIPHLNYTFKYPFELVNGMRHLQNPNGCMMYIHRSVINKVGGFDTGFQKYGYWHGAFSNRVYNAGLIPHPFIDIPDSGKLIYCLDQNGKNKSATPRRGQFLAQNKRRYFEKLNSKEFIPYRKSEEVRVFYSNPYNAQKNIGKALYECCELVPDDAWICLQDGDMMYLTPDWGIQIEEAIKRHGSKYSLIGCMTNRLARDTQRLSDISDNHDILYHYEIAKEERDSNWAEVKEVTKPIAGMFMLFPKNVWKSVKFKENDIAFDDTFSRAVKNIGGKFGVMTGLYVYHFYRGWSDNPVKDRKHLKK